MSWQVYDLTRRPKVIIMVSRLDHCLADLLFRWRMDELRMDIAAIVSNHPDLLPWRGNTRSPSTTFPSRRRPSPNRRPGCCGWWRTAARTWWCWRATCRCCRPTPRRGWRAGPSTSTIRSCPASRARAPITAFERGVKLIGATAHFVTGDLDEGPIIEQMVDRVDHSYDPRSCSPQDATWNAWRWRGPCGCISNAASSSTTTGRWCCSRRQAGSRRRPRVGATTRDDARAHGSVPRGRLAHMGRTSNTQACSGPCSPAHTASWQRARSVEPASSDTQSMAPANQPANIWQRLPSPS